MPLPPDRNRYLRAGGRQQVNSPIGPSARSRHAGPQRVVQPVRDRAARHALHGDRDEVRPRRRGGDRVAAADRLAADLEVEGHELARLVAEQPRLGVPRTRRSSRRASRPAPPGRPGRRPSPGPSGRERDRGGRGGAAITGCVVIAPAADRDAADRRLDIPLAELLDQALGVRRVGPGLVGRAAARPAGRSRPARVLVVRRLPHAR